MRSSPLLFLAFMLPAPALVVVAACDGKLLDVGNNDPPDTRAPVVDAPVFSGFAVDDIACTIEPTSYERLSTPQYSVSVDATCGALGHVRALLRSIVSLPYPQACGVSTELSLGIDNEADATVVGYAASNSGGSCTVTSGPTDTARLPIHFSGTVTDPSGRQHRLRYATDQIPGDDVPDTGSGLVTLSPGPGRPAATSCGATASCAVDTDCSGATAVCGCGLPTAAGPKNLCLTRSTCRIDSDCASGQRCAKSVPAGTTFTTGSELVGNDWALGYFCTTPADDCTCPDSATPGYSCVFSANQHHWGCYGNP